jgi:hypothetical protein
MKMADDVGVSSSVSPSNSPEEIIVFDDSSKRSILSSLGIRKDDESSELINEQNKKLTNKNGETIKLEEFGGILRSSKRVIKKDKTELVKYFLDKE